jgi:hypothetical protein
MDEKLNEKLTEALTHFHHVDLFREGIRTINFSENQNSRESHFKILLEAYVNLQQTHLEALQRHNKNIDLAISAMSKCAEKLRNPPAVNFDAPLGFAKQKLKARDDNFFEAGYLYATAQVHEGLAGKSETLDVDGKHLAIIGDFMDGLQERILSIPIMMAHIKRGLHEEHPTWSEEKLDVYLTENWGSLMEEIKRRGLKINLVKGA